MEFGRTRKAFQELRESRKKWEFREKDSIEKENLEKVVSNKKTDSKMVDLGKS